MTAWLRETLAEGVCFHVVMGAELCLLMCEAECHYEKSLHAQSTFQNMAQKCRLGGCKNVITTLQKQALQLQWGIQNYSVLSLDSGDCIIESTGDDMGDLVFSYSGQRYRA